jgi:LuxR family maltose regulon positive regulatory protein
VLDDYHLIQDSGVDDILTFLLEHTPPSVYLLLASRQEPAFSYAKLRASGQLLELNEHDLRFTAEEASQFLHDVMGLQISAEDIAVLEERTEGWIAGLQLAALSLEGREDVGDFIAGLRGTDRYILDYLAEEVFARLPELLQTFMLRISIVERFNAALCDTLIDDWGDSVWEAFNQIGIAPTGSRSRPILEFLDSSNLFVVPLDHERYWYRFHHLFSEFLQDQLKVRHPEEIPDLSKRASQWFSSEGFLTEAIQHALLSGDPGQAAELIEGQVKPMLSRGETRTLTRMIEALPDEILDAKPALLFGLVWSYTLTDPIRFQSDIQRIVGRFSNALEVTPETILLELSRQDQDPSRRDLLGQFALLLAFLARDSQPFEATIALFQAAESAFSANDFFSRAFAHSGLASTYGRQGKLALAEQAFAMSAEIGQRSDSPFVFLVAKDWEATIQAQRGRLNRAATTFRFVIEELASIAAERLPLTAHAYVGLADVLFEQNDLKDAREFVTTGIDRGQRTIDRDALLDGYILQARILQTLGDTNGAQEALQLGLREAQNTGSAQCCAEAEAWGAILNLAWEDIPAALRWAEAHGVRDAEDPEVVGSLFWIERMALARLRIAQGDSSQAEAILKNMLRELETSELGQLTMEVRCALSVVLKARGDRESAQKILAKALLDGEPDGFMRCFLNEGARMAALLRSAASSGHSPAYVARLLKAFGQTLSEDAPIEPLTGRELDVLRLLSEGLTNAAIAEELVIAQSTVKTHINHIYAKLGVTQRTQAVARGRELHLLP